jgi:hypothetical protein
MATKYYNVILKCLKSDQVVWLKYRTVNRLNNLFELVESNGYKIDYVNLYDAKTKQKVESYAYSTRFV